MSREPAAPAVLAVLRVPDQALDRTPVERRWLSRRGSRRKRVLAARGRPPPRDGLPQLVVAPEPDIPQAGKGGGQDYRVRGLRPDAKARPGAQSRERGPRSSSTSSSRPRPRWPSPAWSALPAGRSPRARPPSGLARTARRPGGNTPQARPGHHSPQARGTAASCRFAARRRPGRSATLARCSVCGPALRLASG
jgi:hypothetical protein